MSENEPDNFKIAGTLLKSTLGFLLLWFGIKIYNEIPTLEELDHTGGIYTYSNSGIKLSQNSMGMNLIEEFHFDVDSTAHDSVMFTNIQQAKSIKEKLSPGDRIEFWYPANLPPTERGAELKQFSINDNIIIPYKPSYGIPIAMICGGIILIILLGFLVWTLVKRKTG